MSFNIGVVYNYKMQPETDQSISSAIASGCVFTSHGTIKMPKDGGVQPEVRDTLLVCHRSLRASKEPSIPKRRTYLEVLVNQPRGLKSTLHPVIVLDALTLNGMFYSYSDNESEDDPDLCIGCGYDCGGGLCRWCRLEGR